MVTSMSSSSSRSNRRRVAIRRAEGVQTVERAVGVGLAGLCVADQDDVAVAGVELGEPLDQPVP